MQLKTYLLTYLHSYWLSLPN